MDEKIIEELFNKISKHFDVVPEAARKFFSMFIQETLLYRDELAEKGEPPLTVEEVQETLSQLEKVLESKKISSDMPPRIGTLLKRWIVKLNEIN